MEKNASEDWIALKDFLDRLWGDRAHRVHTSWLDWVQAKKASNESDDTLFRRFNSLKTQIGNEVNNLAKIEVMLFFARLDEPMQQKFCKQSSMPETKHDLVALAKKLWPNLNREPKPSLPMRICPKPSTSAQLEQKDVLVACFLHKEGCREEIFCSYCKRKGHKRRNVRKNPAILQLEHRWLQWMSLVRVIIRQRTKILLADNESWLFL